MAREIDQQNLNQDRISPEIRSAMRRVLDPTPIRERTLGETWLARVPWEKMVDKQIPEDLLRTITFFQGVEALVEPHYEDLVIAGTASRPNLTPDDIAFMDQAREWGHQEKGHGQFFDGFSREHARVFGDEIPPTHNQATAVLLNQRSFPKRHAPKILAPIARVRPEDYRLVVSLTGTLTEYLTWIGYNSLREKADHPVLDFGLGHIMGEEKTHGEYYFGQAKSELEKNPSKRRLARLFIERFYKPVGLRELGADKFDHSVATLIDSPRAEKFIDEKDRIFSTLPGMENLSPLRNAIESSQKRQKNKD